MNKSEFRERLFEIESEKFCRDYIFEGNPWLFNDECLYKPAGSYLDLKSVFEQELGFGITKDDVFLVGSAYFGFSVSPEKYPKSFTKQSDLDVVIVSSRLFPSVWNALRKLYYSGYTGAIDRHRKDIFRQFVVLGNSGYPNSTYLRDIVIKLNSVKKNAELKAGITFPIKYRIYARKDAALEYHAYGIEKLKQRLTDNDA